ncbi:MAG: hypothetical protein AB7T10_03145 [bacterium]
MKKRIIFAIIVLYVAFVYAADYAETFLSLNPGVLGEGARGSLITFADEFNPMFYFNPANSSTLENSRFFLSYEHKFLFSNNSQYNSASIVMPSVKSVRFGLGYINQLISGIPIYPEYSDSVSFEPTGYFSDNANCILINASYIYADEPLKRFSLSGGLNIKPIIHKIYENTGIGAGIDAGVNAAYYFNTFSQSNPSKASFGFSLSDIGGTRVKWDTDSNTVDIRKIKINAALSYMVKLSVVKSEIFYEAGWTDADEGKLLSSLIYRYNEMAGVFCGITHLLNATDGEQERSYGAGCFIDVLGFGIYYSVSTGELGFSHSVGARYRI